MPGRSTYSDPASLGRITGYVDGVADGVLYGWVANLDRPDELERVIVHGENGVSRACQAFVPRSDVNAALAVPGRFGFAIPLPVLDGLGATVWVTDVNGATLNRGAAIRLPIPPPRPPLSGPPRPWVVLHIQKTAGTSLRAVLAKAVGPGRSVFLYGDGLNGISPAELSAMPPQQRAQLRLIIGHIFFGAAGAIDAHHTTILRNPLARLRSHYHHYVRNGAVFHIDGAEFDPASLISGGLTDEFDNLMLRVVANLGIDQVPLGALDETHVDLALETIRTRFRFVGITEQLDDHLPRLCAAMGIAPAPLPRENVGRMQATSALDARVDWNAVLHRNRFDKMLYDRVQRERLCGRDLAAVAGVSPPP